MTDYYGALQPFKLINLGRQLETPTLVRVDINLPAWNGRVEEDALRMSVYAHILEMYSDYAGLVVMSHQGRKGDDDFTTLRPHMRALRKELPRDIQVDFVSDQRIFTQETKERIRRLKPREIILLDNMRYFEEEKQWNPDTSTYVPFFKGLIRTCVNDSMPTWHRAESSMMCLPLIARTYIGLRSSYELKIMQEVINSKEPQALVMGGAKLQKVSDVLKIAQQGATIFTGGLPGQLIAKAQGYDLGEANNKFLAQKFDEKELADARRLIELRTDSKGDAVVHHPVDFVVEEDGDRENLTLEELPKSKGVIKDIGRETLDQYALMLQDRSIRIRAGPLGIYEEDFENGLELTKRISGEGLIFLGGDTSQELNEGGLLDHIEDSGGKICVSGGSFLHGWAGNSFPSVDLLLKGAPKMEAKMKPHKMKGQGAK
ncbi:MAG: phosphoglycerate kinase [Thaumarchaeota archaeon]|nr:phosphoglycerate kinase [Nitrososphaerota archaeon]